MNLRPAMWRGILILQLLGMLAAGCRPAPPRSADPTSPRPAGGPLRVALAARVATTVVRCDGPCEVRCDGSRWIEPDGGTLRFSVRERQVILALPRGGEARDARAVRIVPATRDARVRHGDVVYGGELHILLDGDALTVVNEVQVDEYLRGVVPWEIGRPGPDAQAAVEAQTIAARTYAESRRGQFPHFDLWADERDQVYRGLERPDAVADRAITATHGFVLEHRGDLIQAYYSSTCGGHTSRIQEVWDKPAQSYLEGRRDAAAGANTSFCRESRHFRWAEAWSGADLERTLRTTLPRALRWPAERDPGGLVDVRIGERDRSGRVRSLEIETTSGTHRVHGDAIRWVLKPNDRPLLRSTMFNLEIERVQGAIVRVGVRGGGNGHGVGMCQMGALAMARAGYDRSAILDHYYPGARLRQTN